MTRIIRDRDRRPGPDEIADDPDQVLFPERLEEQLGA
jgi:hypothetical protein